MGISICDADQTISSPLENYTRRSEQVDTRFFQELFQQEKIAGIVVGLPIHTSGLESQKSIEARRYGQYLGKVSGLPVTFFDERYTSAIAQRLLIDSGMTSKQRKKRIDKIAAQILLATFLESSRESESSRPIED